MTTTVTTRANRSAASRTRWAATGRTGWFATRRAVRSTVSRVRAVTTPVGRAAAAGAVVCGVAGWAAGWAELATLGVALALLVGACALFLLGRPRCDVALDVPQPRTSVGHPVAAHVRFGPRRRSWGARVEVRVGGTVVVLDPPGRDDEGRDVALTVPADRRGVVVVGPVRTVQGDPVGLFRRHEEWTGTSTVHVHPRTVTLPSTSTGFVRDLEGAATRDLTPDDLAFHALREFRPGDERRHVHWKATARTGRLTVRQFEETRRSHVVVALGLARTDVEDEDELELAVSAAASVALRAVRDGRDLTVVTGPPAPRPGGRAPRGVRVLDTSSRARLLDATSELTLADTEVGLGELAHRATHAVRGISVVFLVCGTTPSVRDLRSWSARFAQGVEVVAVVCRPQQSPSLRRISELSVLSVGYLEDLRAALARRAAA